MAIRYLSDPRHGPLATLLLALTVVTGLVDAVSILSLGRVFVANMTGNVVFIGFALAGAPGFSLAASLSALAGFLLGALIGGGYVHRLAHHRGRLLAVTASSELVMLAAALVVCLVVATPLSDPSKDSVAALAAVALGMQNAAVRRLAVPDLTTTVLTMTLTGIAADIRHGDRATALRRLLAVAAMLAGAAVGALLVLHASVSWTLGLATAVVAVVAASAALAARKPAPWHDPQ